MAGDLAARGWVLAQTEGMQRFVYDDVFDVSGVVGAAVHELLPADEDDATAGLREGHEVAMDVASRIRGSVMEEDEAKVALARLPEGA